MTLNLVRGAIFQMNIRMRISILVFSAVFLKIGLTQTCIATVVPHPPHMGTLPKFQEGDKKMQNNS